MRLALESSSDAVLCLVSAQNLDSTPQHWYFYWYFLLVVSKLLTALSRKWTVQVEGS